MKTSDGLRKRCGLGETLSALRMTTLLIVLSTLSACASQPSKGSNGVNMNLAGYPPAFKAGYSDGCSSASGTQRKDAARFGADVQYAQGWRDGFDVCKRR